MTLFFRIWFSFSCIWLSRSPLILSHPSSVLPEGPAEYVWSTVVIHSFVYFYHWFSFSSFRKCHLFWSLFSCRALDLLSSFLRSPFSSQPVEKFSLVFSIPIFSIRVVSPWFVFLILVVQTTNMQQQQLKNNRKLLICFRISRHDWHFERAFWWKLWNVKDKKYNEIPRCSRQHANAVIGTVKITGKSININDRQKINAILRLKKQKDNVELYWILKKYPKKSNACK